MAGLKQGVRGWSVDAQPFDACFNSEDGQESEETPESVQPRATWPRKRSRCLVATHGSRFRTTESGLAHRADRRGLLLLFPSIVGQVVV